MIGFSMLDYPLADGRPRATAEGRSALLIISLAESLRRLDANQGEGPRGGTPCSFLPTSVRPSKRRHSDQDCKGCPTNCRSGSHIEAPCLSEEASASKVH